MIFRMHVLNMITEMCPNLNHDYQNNLLLPNVQMTYPVVSSTSLGFKLGGFIPANFSSPRINEIMREPF